MRKYSSTLCPDGRIRLFANHITSICRPIWTFKCLPDTFCLECVSKVNSILLIIFNAINAMYGAVRVLYRIIIIKSEVRPICRCLGLGHETIICTVYLFYILILMIHFHDKNTPDSFRLILEFTDACWLQQGYFRPQMPWKHWFLLRGLKQIEVILSSTIMSYSLVWYHCFKLCWALSFYS